MMVLPTLARPAPRVPRRRPARGRLRGGAVLLPLAALAVAVALQEALTRTGVLPGSYFPPASQTAAALLVELGGATLWQTLGSTVSTWLLALLIAVPLGTAVGTVLGLVRPVEAFLRPVVEFLRPIPSVALIPLVVLTIGTSARSALFLAVFASFWQVLVPAIAGVRSAHPIALDTARSYSFTLWQRLRWVQLAAMLPHLATATRLATSTSLILVVTAEIIIGIPGLGHEITMSRSVGNPARMYAYIVVSGVAGIVINAVVKRLERALFVSHGIGAQA
ncbi:ABC transporter permease [Desertihabitans brevis]|nr:ABC transporter permease subunit [Desertihabitans brevis]